MKLCSGKARSDLSFSGHCLYPFSLLSYLFISFPGGAEVKASASNVGDPGSIPVLGRSPGEGNGNPLQYACLENPMDRGAWGATVHRVAKSRTRLSNFTFTFTINSSWIGYCGRWFLCLDTLGIEWWSHESNWGILPTETELSAR